MSELQIGLLAIGGVVVAGVLVYNRLQERSAGRAADRAFRSQHADALLDPTLPARGTAAQEAPRPAHRPSAPEPAAVPDPAIDYIVEFVADKAGGQATVQEEWPAIERRHARRALIEADPSGRAWRAGLQLVSRDGAVGEADLIEFRSAIETVAAYVGAAVSAPEMRAAVDRARALDEFCAETDIQVVVHVRGGPFPGTKIRAAAEAGGLALEPDGRFALRNDEQLLIYSLAASDGKAFAATTMKDASPAALSLTLDVGRAPDTRRSFESMARLAHQLASVLGGSIVDDNGNVLDDRAVAAIAQQLDAVRARLEAQGIPPGGPAALRLFS
jgi:FtsZ-interacting cell division protein ZipA